MTPGPVPPARALLWRLMGWAASGGIFLMMLLGFADVVGRKFFDRPVRGSVELTELLMLLVVFLGMTLVSYRQSHVQLDLMEDRVPARWQALRARAGECVSGLVMLGAAWLSVAKAQVAAQQHETTSLLQLPLAPAYLAVAALLAVASLAHVGHAFGPRAPAGSGTLA